ALHVDRSFLRRSAVSLPKQSRTDDILETDRRGDPDWWRLRSVVPAAFRIRTPACARRARRVLRLVSRNGSALQFAAFASHRLAHDPGRSLRAPHSRRFAPRLEHLVRRDRAVRRADLSASCHGCGGRFRARRLLSLLLSRVGNALAGDQEPTRWLLLFDRSGRDRLGRDFVLAMGSFPALACHLVGYCGRRLFRRRTGDFPEMRRRLALDDVVGARTGFVWPANFAALLPPPISRVE